MGQSRSLYLPLLPQFVTYTVPIEATDNYTFEVGADDQMQLFIDDEEQPIFDIVGGIFRWRICYSVHL